MFLHTEGTCHSNLLPVMGLIAFVFLRMQTKNCKVAGLNGLTPKLNPYRSESKNHVATVFRNSTKNCKHRSMHKS